MALIKDEYVLRDILATGKLSLEHEIANNHSILRAVMSVPKHIPVSLHRDADAAKPIRIAKSRDVDEDTARRILETEEG